MAGIFGLGVGGLGLGGAIGRGAMRVGERRDKQKYMQDANRMRQLSTIAQLGRMRSGNLKDRYKVVDGVLYDMDVLDSDGRPKAVTSKEPTATGHIPQGSYIRTGKPDDPETPENEAYKQLPTSYKTQAHKPGDWVSVGPYTEGDEVPPGHTVMGDALYRQFPEKVATTKMPAKAAQDVAEGKVLVKQIDNLINAIGTVDDPTIIQSYMGPISGRLTDFNNKWLGASGVPVLGSFVPSLGDLPPEVVEFSSLLYNVGDAWLRDRTGAQANESEIAKAMAFILPSLSTNPKAALARLGSVKQMAAEKISQLEALGSGPPENEEERARRAEAALEELQNIMTEDNYTVIGSGQRE